MLLSDAPWELPRAIAVLSELYRKIYKLAPRGINTGDCENFALELRKLLGEEGEVYWDDDLCVEAKGHHAFLLYRGKYYDAEAPEGRNCWYDLPFYTRMVLHHIRESGVVPRWLMGVKYEAKSV